MYQISKTRALVSDKIFKGFLYISLCKTSGPRAITWTILVEVHKVKLCIKYQKCGPSAFRQEDF